MIERMKYFIREGFSNIWVNRMMSLASILVLTLCLLLLGSSLLVSMNMRNLMSSMEQQNQIGVFLKDGINQTATDTVSTELKKLPDVQKVEFVSKEQALENEKKQLGKDASLLSGVETDNFLPASYTVTLKSMKNFSGTVTKIKAIANVENVNEHSVVAQKLNHISSVVTWVGFWLFIILAVVSLFIIAYTIKLAVYVRRREVNIMKFVGATDWFIRWPFFVEGLIIGLFSAIVASLLQWYLYGGLIQRLFTALRIVHPISYGSVAPLYVLGFVVSGVVLGSIGSMISVRRYLRV
ncbi:MAG TPA: ABC transporter permease [Ruminococcaceae bacterium]|nr:ABC transporter permease [Oscillospiraceae bacterium]